MDGLFHCCYEGKGWFIWRFVILISLVVIA
jgi:hypothetical protein